MAIEGELLEYFTEIVLYIYNMFLSINKEPHSIIMFLPRWFRSLTLCLFVGTYKIRILVALSGIFAFILFYLGYNPF